MSDKLDILNVCPPKYLSGNDIEKKQFSGLNCTYCNGSGWLWDYDKKDTEKKDCPICHGSGKLDAEVTIKWLPGNKLK